VEYMSLYFQGHTGVARTFPFLDSYIDLDLLLLALAIHCMTGYTPNASQRQRLDTDRECRILNWSVLALIQ
jgi:hypothetical protein